MNYEINFPKQRYTYTTPYHDVEEIVIVIDMQNDFITGTLANKDAERIIKPMVAFLKQKQEEGNVAFLFTQDTHQKNYSKSLEGKHLPIKHCIEGTKGHKIAKELVDVVDNYGIVEKPTFGLKSDDWEVVMWNNHLSNSIKDNQGRSTVKRISLIGTCTDICVISNALALKSLYPDTEIYVYEDLCAGTTPENHQAALQVMKSCQVNIEKYFKD